LKNAWAVTAEDVLLGRGTKRGLASSAREQVGGGQLDESNARHKPAGMSAGRRMKEGF